TSVMSSRSRNWWVSAQAVTQPAVPPPAITTFRIRFFSKLSPPPRYPAHGARAVVPMAPHAAPVCGAPSAVEPGDERGAHAPGSGLVERRQLAACLLRQVLAGAPGRAEHVVLEQFLPRALFVLGAVADGPQQIGRAAWRGGGGHQVDAAAR